MPQGQMLTTLKGIAETLLSLLTLLLQVMMHQIEVNPSVESEDESPHQSETQAMMNNMMQELQAQRNLLQEMMSQQSRASRSEASSARAAGQPSQLPEGSTRRGLPLTRPPTETMSHTSWSVLEEEELLVEEQLVEEAIHRFNHPRGRTSAMAPHQRTPTMALPAPSMTPAPTMTSGGNPGSSLVPSVPSPALNMEEWGRRVITWGRKHRGQTFQYVRTQDPGYVTWSMARFRTLPPDQQDFCRYCQLMEPNNS